MTARRKRLSTFFILATVATILLAACGGATHSAPDVGSSAKPGSAAQQAADFPIALYRGQEVVGGDQVDFSDLLAQGKPVVLNLWAGLCPPCRLEMPDLQEVSDQFADEILLVGLDVGPFTNLGTSRHGQSLVQELDITYPTGTTDDATIVQDYQLLGMPTTVFITPEGKIVRRWTGVLNAEKLSELVVELLEASAGS